MVFLTPLTNPMPGQINIEEFLSLSRDIPVIDVRSPGEYERGHIPGAINIALFDNDERAVIGTLFKRSGQEAAILRGLDIAGKKMRFLAETGLGVSKDKKLILHCWRGGMRSASMSWLFETLGIQCYVLKGGYKTYRRYLRAYFSRSFNLVVIGGMTGSGKSAILDELSGQSFQVLKLEQIAHHKGSAFGRLGEEPQNTNEQFENNIFLELQSLDIEKPIFLEDESRNIGQNIIPPELFERMSISPLVVIEMNIAIRIGRLVEDYGNFPAEELKNCITKISKKLGGQNTQSALASIDEGRPEIAAEISLKYYDKTYTYGLSQKRNREIFKIMIDNADPRINAKNIISLLTEKNILSDFK